MELGAVHKMLGFPSDFKSKEGLKMTMGLRNIITNGKEWKYLLFYDVDNPSEADIRDLQYCLEDSMISYILYTTKHGIHLVGLTPMSIEHYASRFQMLLSAIPEYYSGQTIRIWRKKDEIQKVILYNLDYPIIPNLFERYVKRFFANEFKEFFERFQKNLITNERWDLVFERYWSYSG